MARKLYYFDMKGFGEGIRYILHYGELEFEDVRIPHDDWPKYKESISPPFGKLPMYKEGDITLHQSIVIARYIGRQLDLVPEDPLEEARVDAIIHTFLDCFEGLKGWFREKDPVKKEELKKTFLEETVVFYFTRFDKILAENNGYFGKRISWADLVFVGLLQTTNGFIGEQLDKDYKNVNDLVQKIHNIKGIKLYLESSKK